MTTRFLAILALAAFCTSAAGQGVTQTGGTVNFTFTELAMRIPVTLPVSHVNGVVAPNLHCTSPDSPNAISTDPNSYSDPLDLKTGLFKKVNGKTAANLVALLSAVQAASDRGAKLRELFGLDPVLAAPGPPVIYFYLVNTAQLQRLQMGQEVGALGPNLASPTPSGTYTRVCYTTAQLDQAIAEGLRVLNAILVAMGWN